VDPTTLILLVGMGGLLAAFISMRRVADDGGSRRPRVADPRSLLLGGVLVAAAVGIAYLMLAAAVR
jgi:hypothetical protein